MNTHYTDLMNLMDKDLREIMKSRTFRGVLVGIVAVVIALCIFQAGVFVGETKASFSYKLGDNYYRAFEGRGASGTPEVSEGFMGSHLGDDVPGAFGAAGKVVEVNLPNIVIASSDNVEKTITVSDDTTVRHLQDTLAPQDIAVGDYVIVIGEPDDTQGEIEAKLIRILPPPPPVSSVSTSTSAMMMASSTQN